VSGRGALLEVAPPMLLRVWVLGLDMGFPPMALSAVSRGHVAHPTLRGSGAIVGYGKRKNRVNRPRYPDAVLDGIASIRLAVNLLAHGHR